MKKIVFSILLFGFALISSGQDYIDLVKFAHTHIPSSSFNKLENEEYTSISENPATSVSQTKLSTSLPIKLNESSAFLTGIDYELHRVQLPLKPDSGGFTSVSGFVSVPLDCSVPS